MAGTSVGPTLGDPDKIRRTDHQGAELYQLFTNPSLPLQRSTADKKLQICTDAARLILGHIKCSDVESVTRINKLGAHSNDDSFSSQPGATQIDEITVGMGSSNYTTHGSTSHSEHYPCTTCLLIASYLSFTNFNLLFGN